MVTPGSPSLGSGDAVLLVDPQNDFCPGGSLAVADGDAVLPVLSAWAAAAVQASAPVFVSRDWHPTNTTHFASSGGPWPPHCVAGTPGAAFHQDLHLPPTATVVSKGMGATEDAYSAFQARDEAGNLLGDALRARRTQRLYVMGLATDYCVKESVLAALAEGLETVVIADGIRAVDIHPGDGERALAEMRAAGASVV